MEAVYLETTFISYLVARPSRDLLVAAHQQTTQEWWANRRSAFECCVSQVVIDDAKSLTKAIMAAGILPAHAVRDAAHVAVAAVHVVDYLLTWNCKHLANAQIARRIGVACRQQGHAMPIFCTPEELMGD